MRAPKIPLKGALAPSAGQRTQAIHAGEPEPRVGDAVTMPIFQSATYLLGEPEEFDDIRYIRLNNTPNHESLARKLATLEGAQSALVTSSGTAAISGVLLSCLKPGDHVIAPTEMYGGTRKLFERLSRQHDITVTYTQFEQVEALEELKRPETRMVYVEPLVNPTLRVPALDTVLELAHRHDLLSVVDNTLLTPRNYQPLAAGFDLVLHSASKYLNGHSDVVAGVVAGDQRRIHQIRKTLNLFGVCLDPHACFLLQRGLKTLPLRVDAQNQTAQQLAQALSEQDTVERVHYPGLSDDPYHERASRWFSGNGGLLSFRLRGGVEEAERVIGRLQYAQVAPSLGGVETFVSRPATTSHAGLSAELRRAMGVPEDLIRVAVGLEDAADLIEDFLQALR